MTIKELFGKIRIDGAPVENVIQAQIDADRVTVIYEKRRDGHESVQRAITVESEAVTIG